MSPDILRESTVGELLNWVSGGRILPYPDQRPGFKVPERYLATSSRPSGSNNNNDTDKPDDDDVDVEDAKPRDDKLKPSSNSMNARASGATEVDEKPVGWSDAPTRKPSSEAIGQPSSTAALKRAEAEPEADTATVVDVEAGPAVLDKALENAQAELGDFILVDWYGDDDPENPRNWSSRKRHFVLFEICLLTFSVYIGSAIYTASIPLVTKKFHVSNVVATLGLSLFIEGYALGPMIFSPLQELPSLGRNPAYIYTLALFAILQIPAALSTNIGGLLVLRFLSGFFGSPALATGGASIGDIYAPQYLSYTIGLWAMAAVCGPVLGPIVGGFAANAEGWQWSLWELAWISGFSSIFLALFLPETLAGNILHKRAHRLRKLTGNERLRSHSEIEQAHMSPSAVAREYLIRPFQLMLEPSIAFINIYIGFVYAIFYLWFESFPLVFTDIYGFKGGVAGLPFLGIITGALVAYIFYVGYNYYYLGPKFVRLHFNVAPEEFLRLACFAGMFIPVSLFMFGWTSRESIHWIVPIIAAGLYVPGIFLLFQSALVYLPATYPKYVASIFAGNTLTRSSIAAAFPLFGRTFFHHLGIGGGNSLLAGVAILMIPAMWVLFIYGARFRAMSKYTQH